MTKGPNHVLSSLEIKSWFRTSAGDLSGYLVKSPVSEVLSQ